MRELFPEIEPFNIGFLDVGSGHQIYFEESGNKNGIPILKIHGGPGSNSKPKHRQLFNPEKYRIICFDQRGCGQSKFSDPLVENTTQELVKDMDRLRKYLNIEKWIVNGSSWGSLLALEYCLLYPDSVKALFVSGIFFGEVDDKFAYQSGAHYIFPKENEELLKYFGASELNIFKKMNEKIFQKDFENAYLAANKMFKYETSLMSLFPQVEEYELIDEDIKRATVNSAKIYLHYANNKYFIAENHILENAHKLSNIPTYILHGKYDMVCPYRNAYLLSKEIPKAKFITIIAGHYYSEPENIEILLQINEDIADSFSN